MRRSRFSEEQIIGILKEYQAGLGVAELYRKYGGSDATCSQAAAKRGRSSKTGGSTTMPTSLDGLTPMEFAIRSRSEHNQTPLTCT